MSKSVKKNVAVEAANEAIANKYIAAIDKRLLAQAELNAADTAKLNKARRIFADSKVIELLDVAAFNETIIFENKNKDFYCAKSLDLIAMLADAIAHNHNKFKALNENMLKSLQTLINLSNANFDITKEDIVASLDKSHKVANSEKQRLIVSRADAYSSASRQSTMMLNMMRDLNIVTQVSRDAYKMNDNAIASAFRDYMSA